MADQEQQAKTKRVLIVDGDHSTARPLERLLGIAGYEVLRVTNVRTARAVLEDFAPDLIVLEMMLPNALQILMSIPVRMHPPRIVIRSGTRRRQDAALALRLGADDFIPKPVDLPELIARLARIVPAPDRHVAAHVFVNAGELHVGGLVFQNPPHIRAGAVELRVSPTQYRILKALASRPGGLVTKEELAIQGAFDPDGGSVQGVAVQLHRLRRRLQSSGLSYPRVEAVRGKGYRLALEPPAGSDSGRD